MSELVKIKVNAQEYEVEEGMRLIPVLEKLGIKIPHICFHHALTPAVSCRLCVVEVREGDKPPRIRYACATKTKEGMEIVTESAMIYKLRTEAIGNLLKMAPQAEIIHRVAQEFSLATGIMPDGCIRCRLCIRVCKNIIGANALRMVKRKDISYVAPSETGDCIGCATCVSICPTGAIQCIDQEDVRTIKIRDEVIGRHSLERCEICGRRFATTKFLKRVEEIEEEKHPEKKEKHVLCPTCAKLFARRDLTPLAPHLSKTYAGKPLD